MNTIARAARLISTLAAAASLSTAASAQALATSGPVCPARYEPMNGLCYDMASGDVVFAEASQSTAQIGPKPSTSATAMMTANCPTSYAFLYDTLCYSSVTGDIQVASRLAPDQMAKLQATGKQR